MKPTYTIQGIKLDYPELTLHELLQKQAVDNPEAIAIQYRGEKVSYGEFQKRINKVAHYLWNKGVRPNQIVAISLDRSPELLVSIYAILQCGAAYVPIDSTYPKKRLEMVVEDSMASYVICYSSKTGISEKSKNIFIEDISKEAPDFPSMPLELDVKPQSVAYIIYTSGSTGKPKGVQVAHCNVINLIYSMGKEPGIGKNDKIFALSTISFDAMVLETFLPLGNGACVVIVDEETRLDGELLLQKAYKDKITIMFGTPSIYQILLDSGWKNSLNIKALIGGEPLPMTLAHNLIERCNELWNLYGPTETTVLPFLTRVYKEDNPITIGKPIANTYAYLLDEKGLPVKPDEIGEIVVGGDCVSLGYLNRPELTNERFISDPFNTQRKGKMYLTGDLGKLLSNGKIQCLGRRDHQVKIRGHRIELDEVETVIDTLPDIKKAAVIVSDLLGGEPKMVAYLQSDSPNQDTHAVRSKLEAILPEYMIPSTIMWIDEFPITISGKIDKKNLPLPKYERPESAPLFKKPRTKLEKRIASIWSEQLKIPSIGIDDNFFEMGGTSLLTQKVATLMNQNFDFKVPVAKIYQYPTIASLSAYFNCSSKSSSNNTESFEDYSKPKRSDLSSDVAVIGMSGRFPGAKSIDELWEVLKNGVETISFFTPEELDDTIPESLRNDPLYVRARGILPSANTFDAKFFGLNPILAKAMDPQQRIFLEIAWEALEQSGHLPKNYKGRIGVYAGTGTNTYYHNNILTNKELLNQVGSVQANTVNEKDYIATRTAYHLNLKGPAVSVHSACSTSLLAIAEAVESIRNNQCDIALAGGSSVTAPIYSGHLYQEGSMLSPDGHCRSFDVNGKGTVFSDGAGVVLLKNLEKAKKDGDFIYGVIKGVGINNDGGVKGSFTAPCIEGQANAINRALHDGQISPSSISYVETHGTATPIGDPIEIEGLHKAFGKQDRNGYCALGTIKSNMGHLTAAAGVAGVIKTMLALKHKKIPASLGFEKANPSIDFENSPFFVNNTLKDWDSEGKRRAGISSFGVGGTNVHIIAEEFENEQKTSGDSKPLQILTWSAKTDKSLDGYKTALGNYIKSSPDINLADVAFSLSATRDTFKKRSFILTTDSDSTINSLLSDDSTAIKTSELKSIPNNLAFLFPGQGAQYLQMGKALYEHEEVFRTAVNTCSQILMNEFNFDIRKIIYPENNTVKAENRLKETQFTQPALFVIEYALARLWLSWGVKPTLLCGHSIGEFVAAHLAGVFSLKDALFLVAVRGKLVSQLPGGSMLSVRTNFTSLSDILPKTLSMAAVNSDQLCVLSGEDKDVEAFAKVLEQKEIPNRLLLTSHAFHSKMMDPVIDIFEEEVKKTKLNVPRIPIISTVTGNWLSDAEAIDPKYWANHLRATVRFSEAMDTALGLEDIVLLEVGPGRALTTLSQQKKRPQSASSISSLVIPGENKNAYHTILSALGQLWLNGIEPNWQVFYKNQSRQRVLLPHYVFDRKLCWVDPPKKDVTLNEIPTLLINKSIQPNHNTCDQPNLKTATSPNRKIVILEKVAEIVLKNSGIEIEAGEYDHSFIELGLDSLVLTQIAINFKNEFKTPITFRQLNDEFNSPILLASYLDKKLSPEHFAPVPIQSTTAAKLVSVPTKVSGIPIDLNYRNENSNNNNNNNHLSLDLIAQQIQLLTQQLELVKGAISKEKTGHQSLINGTNRHTNLTPEEPKNNVNFNGKKSSTEILNTPPLPGARLGIDASGNPAWFTASNEEDGEYIKIEL
ncbi:polyketide synthase [Algibacter mikhailovii]|uniref:polyketide synthase n=1 Tax=Algibacter mikhailovii TaxID=425498 RepID=UPI0024946B03|nr:polyketide synthase [Algibacter mikhailovii]